MPGPESSTVNTIARWATRPVFISSTFRDMQAERDHLRQHVLPRLEEKLRERRHHLDAIDLRQGVESANATTEEARELQVLKVCLSEIDRSRPFLIVLLGDRYGWVPPAERMEAAAREAGFFGTVAGRSVTALEIEFGIFRKSPEQRRRCFFYFREPLPYELMPPALRPEYSDRFNSDPGKADRRTALAELKQRLRADPELAPRIHTYRAGWDSTGEGKVSGLEAWGEQVFQHLWQELEEETRAFIAKPDPTVEEAEREALAEFIEHRTRDFTGREDIKAKLLALARSSAAEGAPWSACVTGAPGSGKSALFAMLHRELEAAGSVLLLANAAGGTPRGSSVDALLRRWILELADFLGVPDPLPEKPSPDDVEQAFASLLGRAALKRRVVLLLDALNQFEDTPRARHLTWRPKLWPPNARLLATSLPGPEAEALSQWAGVEELELPPLTETDARDILKRVWQRWHVPWSDAVFATLATRRLPDGTPATGNPLWLTLAGEQLALLDADDFARAERQFPGEPQARLEALRCDLAGRFPPDVPGLYEWLLAQTEKIHGTAYARAFATVMALSRSGWRERDLRVLVPRVAVLIEPGLNTGDWNELKLAALRRSFRAHLVRRGVEEQWNFHHAQMREVVPRHAEMDDDKARMIHQLTADYLLQLPESDTLRVGETMFHAIGTQDAGYSCAYYGSVTLKHAAFAASTATLARHLSSGSTELQATRLEWVLSWLTVEGCPSLVRGLICDAFISKLHGLLCVLWPLRLQERLLNGSCNVLAELCVSDPENDNWRYALSCALDALGELAKRHGDIPEAKRFFTESQQHRRQLTESSPTCVPWRVSKATSLVKLGEAAMIAGDLVQAQSHFEASLDILKREVANSDDAAVQRNLAVSYHKLGEIGIAQGKLLDAKRMLGEDLRIVRRLTESAPCNTDLRRDLSVSLEMRGNLALLIGDLSAADRFFGESMTIRQALAESDRVNARWQSDLAWAESKLGDLAFAKENLVEAKRRFHEALRIREGLALVDSESSEWLQNVALSHHKLAVLAQKSGENRAYSYHASQCRKALLRMESNGMHLEQKFRNLLLLLHAEMPNSPRKPWWKFW